MVLVTGFQSSIPFRLPVPIFTLYSFRCSKADDFGVNAIQPMSQATRQRSQTICSRFSVDLRWLRLDGGTHFRYLEYWRVFLGFTLLRTSLVALIVDEMLVGFVRLLIIFTAVYQIVHIQTPRNIQRYTYLHTLVYACTYTYVYTYVCK